MKILAFTPLHPDYGARPETWASIQAAIDAYDGAVDWVISSGDNPHDEPYENITAAHNKARWMVLKSDYDYLLSVEADMIIPPHTINGLLECESDIAYGLYVWRHKLKRWNAYYDVGLFGGYSYTLKPQKAREMYGGIVDVEGLGMGCTLISRKALGRLRFRLYEGLPGDWLLDEYADEAKEIGQSTGMVINLAREHKGFFCDDWILALDAQHYGFSQRCNTAVTCGHIEHDGSVIWPNPLAGNLYHVERRANGVPDSRAV